MVVPLIVVAQLVAARPAGSAYTSPALRQLVARAAVANRRVPDGLQAYRARVETEMAFIARESDGAEQTLTVEQTASVVRWHRTGAYEQRVVGYRSQSVGFTISAAGLFRQAWTVPVLYGNRIALLFGREDSTRAARRLPRRQGAMIAVHPFADDRDEVYRFSGGDTVVTLNPGGRTIPLVRVHVEPNGGHLTRRTIAFRGDIELDALRAEIVRMRGSFVTVGPSARLRSRLMASQVDAIAYVELENAEFQQRFWLPAYQRIEAHASFALIGGQRAVFRAVSRFRALDVNPVDADTVADANARTDRDTAPMPTGDSLHLTTHRLTFAPGDSIDRYSRWARGIGEETGAVRADDFIDIAPDDWRPIGRPIGRLRYREASDLFHYNRVEGAYTGLAGEVQLRDAAPGVSLRANVGWAWSEHTVRGRVAFQRQRGQWWLSIRAGRSLDLTNDFREPFDSGSTLGALVSADDYDYVDRRSTEIGLTRLFGRQQDIRLRLEGGLGSDTYAVVHRTRGPLARGDSGFRFNRGVDDGRYRAVTLKLELHPDINAAFVRPGFGALFEATRASGDIAWSRAELRISARRTLGPIIYAARADAGVVTGDSIPPQQLFELGENQNLPGYRYKEFAGNEAAVIRGLVMYPLPYWRAPIRFGRWTFPGIAPMMSVGAQSGWAAASNATARAAVLRLGTVDTPVVDRTGGGTGAPVSRPTEGLKSSVDIRIRVFGGAVSAGLARAIDRHEPWRLVIGLAQVL